MADLPQQGPDAEVQRLPASPLPFATTPPIGSAEEARRHTCLARVIESEVIPRLVLARRTEDGRAGPVATGGAPPSVEEVMTLAGLVVDHDLPEALAFVERVRERGVSVESVYLDLLAPAARELGRQWEDDRRTFSEVTVGLWRLHQLLYELSPIFQRDAVAPSSDLRALLVTAPGEQHSFGLAMTAEFFRRAGWLVSGGPLLSGEDLPTLVHREWFAIVGISAGSGARLDSVARAIHEIRRASRNRALGILVGGVAFGGHPERVALVGADGCADDARRAPLQARALLDLLVRRDRGSSTGLRGRAPAAPP